MPYPYYPQTYPQNYLNYQQSYPQNYPQVAQTPQPNVPQTTDMNWVQGESGAKGYHVSPNTTVTLWDSESQTIYVKSANAVGVPTITVLDYVIRNNEPKVSADAKVNYATTDDIEILKNEIKELKNRLNQKDKVKKNE